MIEVAGGFIRLHASKVDRPDVTGIVLVRIADIRSVVRYVATNGELTNIEGFNLAISVSETPEEIFDMLKGT